MQSDTSEIFKYFKTSKKYPDVKYHKNKHNRVKYFVNLKKQKDGEIHKLRGYYNSQRLAALAIDKFLLSIGMKAKYILKKK